MEIVQRTGSSGRRNDLQAEPYRNLPGVMAGVYRSMVSARAGATYAHIRPPKIWHLVAKGNSGRVAIAPRQRAPPGSSPPATVTFPHYLLLPMHHDHP